MKKIISVVLAISLIISVSLSLTSAFTFEHGFSYLPLEDGISAEIIAIDPASLDLEIPSEIDGYKVVGIGDGALKGNGSVCFVEVPDGVKYIGDEAFLNCISIRSIYLPETLESIGDNVLSGCTDIKNIYYRGSRQQWSEINIGNTELTARLLFAYEPGDIDGNWNINSADSWLMKKYMAGQGSLNSNETLAADISGDGSINAVDSYLQRSIIVGIDNTPYKLFVNGKEVTGDFSIYYRRDHKPHGYMEIPILSVLTALGAYVAWIDETSARIFFEEEVYIFDAVAKNIFIEGTDFDVMYPLPGGYGYPSEYRFTGSDLIIDDGVAAGACFLMGRHVVIIVDQYDYTVNINDR